MSKKISVFVVAALVLLGGLFIIFGKDNDASLKSQDKDRPASAGLDSGEISKFTIDNPDSIYYIVNKKRALPPGFVPKNLVSMSGIQLRSDTANALNQLLDAARAEGINLKIISGYRSYQYQQNVYGDYVRRDGRAKADTYSARPGHSEHQTGLAADLGTGACDLQICFGDTAGGRWLAKNAYKYGFIIRYPKGKENRTGYQYEPWHLRYLGIDLATKVYESGQTLEQFFGLPNADSY